MFIKIHGKTENNLKVIHLRQQVLAVLRVGHARHSRSALKASKCRQRCCIVRVVSESDTDAPEEITWLSTKEAAKRLGVTPRTLYRFIDEGQLITHEYDGFWRSMDTLKDKQQLEEMFAQDDAPWQVWRDGATTRDNGDAATRRSGVAHRAARGDGAKH